MRFTSKFTTLILSLLLLNSLCAASTKNNTPYYEFSEYVAIDYTDETKDSSDPHYKALSTAQIYHKSGSTKLKKNEKLLPADSFFSRVTSHPLLPQAPPVARS